MRKLVKRKFTKILLFIMAVMIAVVSLLTMTAMDHSSSGSTKSITSCASGFFSMSDHNGGCSEPIQSDACIDFHFSFLSQFANTFNLGSEGLNLMEMFVLFALLLFAIADLFYTYKNNLNIAKVRLKCLFEETTGIFRDNLGFWLTLVEKRDPSPALALL